MSDNIVENPIYVTVHYVASMHKEGFLLEKNLDYADIADAIFQGDEVSSLSPDTLKISISNKSGWELELYDGAEYDSSKITVNRIVADDILTVRIKNDRIGGRELISVLQSAYEKVPVLRSRYKYLSNSYCGYRTIKNDGNGYFRSIYFGLFENIILTNQRHIFSAIQQKFYNLLNKHNDTNNTDDNFATTSTYLNFVIDVLEGAADDRRWLTVEELEADILDSEYEFDYIFILMLRKLVVEFIIQNRNMKLAGSGTVSLEKIIMEHYSEYDDLESYCSERLLLNGASMEGPVADYGCMFYAINCAGIICLVERKKEIKLSITTVGSVNINSDDQSVLYANIHLILRGGHYDLLYLEDDMYNARKGVLTDSSVLPTPPRSPMEVQNARFSKKDFGSGSKSLSGESPVLGVSVSTKKEEPDEPPAPLSSHNSRNSTRDDDANTNTNARFSSDAPAPAPEPNSRPSSLQKVDSMRSSGDGGSNSSNRQEQHRTPSSTTATSPALIPQVPVLTTSPAPSVTAASLQKQTSRELKTHKSFTMETMEEELAALDIRIDDKNIVFDLCTNCTTIPQAVAMYYKKYAYLSRTMSDLTRDLRTEESSGDDDDDDGIAMKVIPSVIPGKGPVRAFSGISLASNDTPRVDSLNSNNSNNNSYGHINAGMLDSKAPPAPSIPTLALPTHTHTSDAPGNSNSSNISARNSSPNPNSAREFIRPALSAPNPSTATNNTGLGPNSCANTDFLDRQFLPLLSLGFDIDQILEAVDVGECNNFEVAHSYLKRKLKWMMSRSQRNLLANMGSEADSNTTANTINNALPAQQQDPPSHRTVTPSQPSQSQSQTGSKGVAPPRPPTPPKEKRGLKSMGSMFFSKMNKSGDAEERKDDDGDASLRRSNSGGTSKLRSMQSQSQNQNQQEAPIQNQNVNLNQNQGQQKQQAATVIHKPKPKPSIEKTSGLTAVQQQIVTKLASTGVTHTEAVELAEQFNTIDEFCDFIENMEKKKKQSRPHLSRQKSMAPPTVRSNMTGMQAQPQRMVLQGQMQGQASAVEPTMTRAATGTGSKWGKLKMATKVNAAIAKGGANGDMIHNPRSVHNSDPNIQNQNALNLNQPRVPPGYHQGQHHSLQSNMQSNAKAIPQYLPLGAGPQQLLQQPAAPAASVPLVPFGSGTGSTSKAAEAPKKKSTWGVLKSFVGGGTK